MKIRKKCFSVLICVVLFAASNTVSAYDWLDGFNLQKREGDRYNLIFSPYSYHFHQSDEHKHVWLVGMDRERHDSSLAGFAYFKNSFGQDSVYIFPWGRVYRNFFDRPEIYAKLSAGLLYGYRGQYEHKVPFNHNGFSPGVVPALGWETKEGYQAQVNLLGISALMFQMTVPIR